MAHFQRFLHLIWQSQFMNLIISLILVANQIGRELNETHADVMGKFYSVLIQFGLQQESWK